MKDYKTPDKAEGKTFRYEFDGDFVSQAEKYAGFRGVSVSDFVIEAIDFAVLLIAARSGEDKAVVECVSVDGRFKREPFGTMMKEYGYVRSKGGPANSIDMYITEEEMQSIMLGAAYRYSDDEIDVSTEFQTWEQQRFAIGGVAEVAVQNYIARLNIENAGMQIRINQNLGAELSMYLEQKPQPNRASE